MSSSFASKGHVYFGSEGCTPKDNSIAVTQNSPGFVQIHLGFLQYHHIYNVCFEIPKTFFMGYDIHAVLEAAEKSLPNTNCKIISIEEKREVFAFITEFRAEKEGLVKESLKLCLVNDIRFNLDFSARVLGTGKGTPLLKNGIKCMGVLNDEMSEASDWHG